MVSGRVAAPTVGSWARAALVAGFLLILAGRGEAQRLPFRPLAPDTRVTWSPRLPVRALPVDDRIAPDDFIMDELVEPLPTAAQQAALADRVGAFQLSQDYTPRPAIWRIGARRPGGRDTTIWLFGTVHVLPPGFRWRSPGVEAIARRAKLLLVESVDAGAGLDALAAPGSGPPPAPLVARVNPSHRAKLEALMATLPPPAAAVLDGLPTWIAAVAVSVVRDIRAGELPGPGADDWLETQFRAAGKPVLPIEDGAKVLAAANAIPDAEQRAMLDEALDAPPLDRAASRAPLHAWAKGEVGPGSPIVVALQSAALSDALLDRRNAAWARQLKQRLRIPGELLFAAGAGHFIGRGSVIERLEAEGVRVTRVE